ncbi:MAG: Ig-like domain-containing protein [Erysipelotrichaceae bacterium]|nr:Ig-like domain-containing protein [Erysipelotrichaceae bacterium]
MKKRKLNNRALIHLVLSGMLVFFFLLALGFKNGKAEIVERYIINDSLYVKFDHKVSCFLNDEWTDTDDDNILVIPVSEAEDTLKIKNSSGNVYTLGNDLSELIDYDDSQIYLAKGASDSISYPASQNATVTYTSENDNVVSVDEKGTLYGNNNGDTTVQVKINDLTYRIDVTVTDLIVPVNGEFDYDKPFITPDLYTKEENDLLDEILVSRVEKVGYKTRAAAVEAARFLALEFPYRIHYFTENGRIDSYVGLYCDGEGRYYHKGLYLDESRYALLDSELISDNPAYWGEIVYDYTNDQYWPNGMDCSGFVSWCLLQAGYDPGDLGAGIAEWEDLSDLGPKIDLRSSLDEIRTGDLLVGGDDPIEGGHIAILVGKKDGYFYVAESQQTSEYYWGYCIRKYSAEELLEYFFYREDMSAYYGDDGVLTDYWLD